MATRLLLTLLVLLTGFAAQMSPAQARLRAAGASEIGAVVASVRSEKAAIAAPRPAAPVADRDWRASRCTVVMLRKDADCAPAVMLGSDRARE